MEKLLSRMGCGNSSQGTGERFGVLSLFFSRVRILVWKLLWNPFYLMAFYSSIQSAWHTVGT